MVYQYADLEVSLRRQENLEIRYLLEISRGVGGGDDFQ